MTSREPRNAPPGRRVAEAGRPAASVRNGRLRLWRARRRHHHIDAVLGTDAGGWAVEYLRDDRPLVTRDFSSEASARDDAAGRLKELQRAGWVVHW